MKENITEQTIQIEQRLVVAAAASSIGHEINNHLTSFTGLLGLMLEEDNLSEEFLEDLTTMKQSVDKMKNFSKKLLELGKVSAFKFKSVEIEPWLISTLEKMQEQNIITEDIDLEFSLLNKNTVLEIAPAMFEEMIRNIIINARDAMLESEKKKIILRTALEKDSFELSLEDTGCGIEHTNAIFDLFYTTKSDRGGAGLGMGIVKAILRQHNAVIKVESFVGQGTKICVILPVIKI